jgi:hypothetical protein
VSTSDSCNLPAIMIKRSITIPILVYSFPSSSNYCMSLTNLTNYIHDIIIHRMTQTYPFGCDDSPGNECIRGGGNTYLILSAVVIVIPIICVIYVVVIMGRIYCTVANVEHRADRHRFVPRFQQEDKKKKKQKRKERWSTRIWKQGLMHSGTLISVWIFPIIFYIAFIISRRPHYAFYLLLNIFYPIQGILNFIIYMIPRRIDVQHKRRGLICTPTENAKGFFKGVSPRKSLRMEMINNCASKKNPQTHNDKHENESLAEVSFSNADDKELSYNSGEEEKTEIKEKRNVVCFDYKGYLGNV